MDTNTVVAPVGPATDTRGRRIAPRQHRSLAEKEAILAEAFAPGASVAEVARRLGVNTNLVFGWRRLQEHDLLGAHTRGRRRSKLLPVKIVAAPAASAQPAPTSALRVEFPGGVQLHVTSGADVAVLERVIALLRR